MIRPEWGIWFIPTALLPLVIRVLGGRFRLHLMDWLVIIFVLTAWAGYWAAYDEAAAWNKAWLIVIAGLLYFSLKAQPQQNLFGVSVAIFCLGVGISLYYFLTHDFVALPRRLELVNQIGRWIMDIRPQVGWTPIHPNYVAGMIAITVPFILYPVWLIGQRLGALPFLPSLLVGIGLGFAALALVMATSRGVVLAILSGAGGWLVWRSISLSGIRRQIKSDAVFPILLLIYLFAVVAFLYSGPARSGSLFTGDYFYGNGSRAELFSRSLYLLFDYPITGGGLGSFPGLYSQYLLGIPFYNVPNSHNLFLDVGIEQGLFGGLAFLILYFTALWGVSGGISREENGQTFRWIVLFSLIVAIVHGMVDDYLYNGVGAMLSLLLAGLAVNSQGKLQAPEGRVEPRVIFAIAIIWTLVIVVNLNPIRAVWHANLGAVQLSKEELKDFPDAGWHGEEIIPRLDAADSSLRSSLQLDPANRTSNQRLGLISMYRRDFSSAVRYLETAHAQAPDHRGIVKSLAYCYIWLGAEEKALALLPQIPEASEELDVYVWWWQEQGRSDLSENASMALDAMQK